MSMNQEKLRDIIHKTIYTSPSYPHLGNNNILAANWIMNEMNIKEIDLIYKAAKILEKYTTYDHEISEEDLKTVNRKISLLYKKHLKKTELEIISEPKRTPDKFPRFVKLSNFCLRLIETSNIKATYFRDAGVWEVNAHFVNNTLQTTNDNYPEHLNNIELIPTTIEEWKNSNRGYVNPKSTEKSLFSTPIETGDLPF